MKRLVVVGVVLTVITVWAIRLPVEAKTLSSWLTNDPILGEQETIASGSLPKSVASAGNISCIDKSYTLKPYIPGLQDREKVEACAVLSSAGWTAPGTYSDAFEYDATILNSAGGRVNYYPVPGSGSGIVLVNTPLGTMINFYTSGLHGSRQDFNPTTRELLIYMNGHPSWTLKDRSGKTIYIRPESIAFSRNGRWLVVESEHLASIRVDLDTAEILPFSRPYVYHLGLSVDPNLAISDDGNTVVRASNRADVIVTDLSTCSEVPDAINGPVDCKSKDLSPWLRSSFSGYYRAYNLRFVGLNQISLYVRTASASGAKALIKTHLAPAGYSIARQQYLALGDSFTSGEGAYNYFPETDTQENKCHLSRNSYPYIVGQQLGMSGYNSVACSGARIGDIVSKSQKPTKPVPNSLGGLLPGYKSQLQYVEELSPKQITVGIGGNDSQLISRLKACLAPGTCYSSYEDRLEAVQEINRQYPKLVDLYKSLKSSRAKVFVIGYPKIADETGACSFLVPLDPAERKFANGLVSYLNSVIYQASKKAGVIYIDSFEAFRGSLLCQPGDGRPAMNGIVLGDDIPFGFGPFGSESFHPTQFGHQLLAQAIISKSEGLGLAMTDADDGQETPSDNPDIEMLKIERVSRQIRKTYSDEALTDDVLIKGQVFMLNLSGEYNLVEGQAYRVEIHSIPQMIGEFIATGGAEQRVEVWMPDNVEVGFHDLHVVGPTVSGEAQDIHKTVYAGHSLSDIDGDGVPNNQDTCNGFVNIGVDADGDKVDDACDDLVPTTETFVSPDSPPDQTHQASSVSAEESDTKSGVLGAIQTASNWLDARSEKLKNQYHRPVRLFLATTTVVGIMVLFIYHRRRRKR